MTPICTAPNKSIVTVLLAFCAQALCTDPWNFCKNGTIIDNNTCEYVVSPSQALYKFSISSPNWPASNYETNTTLRWRFVGVSKHVYQLSFGKPFQLIGQSTRTGDFVRFLDGNFNDSGICNRKISVPGTLAIAYNASSIPPWRPYVVTDLIVEFCTMSNISGRSFNLLVTVTNYTSDDFCSGGNKTSNNVCVVDFPETTESKELFSPGWPFSYENNAKYRWVLQSIDSHVFNLYFSTLFWLESPESAKNVTGEYVRIIEGQAMNQPVCSVSGYNLNRYNGQTAPPARQYPGKRLLIDFCSDAAVVHYGFQLIATLTEDVELGTFCKGTNVTTGNPCTLTFRDEGSKTIMSPGYPYSYGNRLKLRWIVNANFSAQFTLTFPNSSTFEIENLYDWVSFIDPADVTNTSVCDKNAAVLAKFWSDPAGSDRPPATSFVLTGERQLIIEFCTDAGIVRKGFTLNIAAARVQTEHRFCESVGITTDNQTCTIKVSSTGDETAHIDFKSPGYPYSYRNNVAKRWILRPADQDYVYKFDFQFVGFHLGKFARDTVSIIAFNKLPSVGEPCQNLTYFDETAVDSTTYRGAAVPDPIHYTAKVVFVDFCTDSTNVSTGFELLVNVTRKQKDDDGAGEKPNGTSTIVAIAVTAVLGVLLMVAVAAALANWRGKAVQKARLRKLMNEQFSSDAYRQRVELSAELPVNEQLEKISWDTKNFEIPCSWLKITKINLGRGVGGKVDVGVITLPHGEEFKVAVKQPHLESKFKDRYSDVHFKGLMAEIKILAFLSSKISHVNVVGFCGAVTCRMDKGFLCAVTPLCSNGSLLNFLRRHSVSFTASHTFTPCLNGNGAEAPTAYLFCDGSDDAFASTILADRLKDNFYLTPYDLLAFAYQIASGMEHIEKLNIVHGDLAARNVFLDENHVVKIADFGLASRKQYFQRNPKVKLAAKWSAIEVLAYSCSSSKSDVWSFGVLLYEIFSLGQEPYRHLRIESLFDYLSHGNSLERPPYATNAIVDLMRRCLRHEPTQRPSFTECRRELEGLLYSHFPFVCKYNT